MRETPWGAVRPTETTRLRSEATTAAPSRRFLAIFAAISLVLSLFVVLAGPAFGQTAVGTVKIHEGGGEPGPGHEEPNEPKVCTFHLHGFDFAEGETVLWEIHQQPPTGNALVRSGSATPDGDGEWRDPDADGTIQAPLPEGHYKLSWDYEDDPSAGKFKVFSVDCGDETTTTVAPTTTTTVAPTTTIAPTTSTTVADEVLGTVVTTSTTAPAVQVSTTIVDEVLGTHVEADELPFTGIDSDRLVGLAVLLLAGGLVALGATGRREES